MDQDEFEKIMDDELDAEGLNKILKDSLERTDFQNIKNIEIACRVAQLEKLISTTEIMKKEIGYIHPNSQGLNKTAGEYLQKLYEEVKRRDNK